MLREKMTNNPMNRRKTNLKIIADACAKVSDTMALTFGCKIDHVYWYKSEKDKKDGKVDWMQTGHHIDGRSGTIVKDLRESDHLPMWVDYGDQLEFSIDPEDIVSFRILGREAQLHEILLAIEKRSDINISQDKYPSGIIEIQAMLNEDEDRHIDWNLAAGGVEHQEDSTIAFIAELLK